jgi:hypothetical protein
LSHNPSSFVSRLSPHRLLIAAAVLHLALVGAISLVGKAQLLPGTLDEHGIGISFAIDSSSYRREATEMAQLLRQRRFQDWINYRSKFRSTFHIRLYSITFTLLGNVLGFGILAAELLNLVYYLSILGLTYAIGAEVFDRRVGLLAAIAVSVWPSLLLHTTQMLRDPLFIASMLLLIFSLSLCLQRALSILQGLAVGATGAVAVLLIWLCRADMWEIVFVVLLLAVTACAVHQVKGRRFEPGKTVALMGILLFAFSLPKALPAIRLSDRIVSPNQVNSGNRTGATLPASVENRQDGSIAPWTKFSRQVGLLRHKFIAGYPLAGSNIDTNVELRGPVDLIRYLPRAMEIGFLSPFPMMWFTTGVQVGAVGRLVAGAEMFVMYFVLTLASLTLVNQWKRLSVWFLFSTSTVGCVALGYVVVNISSLYRMRYAFFILVIILGIKGLLISFEKLIEPRAYLDKELRTVT